MSKKLKIALPKGSLQDSTVELFRKAGYNVYVSSRGYRPTCDDDDLELFLIRAQEIGRYVNDGFIDCGITGRDWIYENRADVEVLTDLQYSKATSKPTRWVLVVPENSPITCAEDLQGKRIATEGVGITERWLQEKGIKAHVEFSWGATEVKVPELVDAIVDITETGSSIKANKLRIVDTLMTSYPQFIANRETMQDEWKKQKLESLVMMLRGALEARRKVGLKMNLPAAPSPTWRKKAGWPWKRSLTNPSSGISFRSSRPSARKASLNTRSTSWSTNFFLTTVKQQTNHNHGIAQKTP